MRGRIGLLAALFLIAGLASGARAGPPAATTLAAEIDHHIDAQLIADGRSPGGRADDAEFLRRAYLDLHGVIPSFEQAVRFLDDPAGDKRQKLIDELLADPRYGRRLADEWQGYLMSPLADDRARRSSQFADWLAEQFNTRTWDRIAADLLTATGKMEENPAVTYLIEGRLPRGVPDLTDLASRYFLGIRLNCAQCHDHPFVDVKQEAFWGMAAFFTQVQTPRRAKQVYERGVIDDPSLTLATLRDAGMFDGYMSRPPTFLGGKAAPAGKTPHRKVLADWMTSADNPYFARAAVNRTWWRLFGRGLVQPVDDLHDGNPSTHPALLELLARRFVESGFDLKYITRAIVLSKAYQRTSAVGSVPATQPANASIAADRQSHLFGRMSMKVLSAAQLYDSMEMIFGPPAKVQGIDAREGARWEFVQFFGDTADPDPTAYRRGIAHLLRQMNGSQFVVEQRIDALLERLSYGKRPEAEVVADLFVAILSRRPTSDEAERIGAFLRGGSSSRQGLHEVVWAMVMIGEFSLNH